jgi:hypothetical protein
MFWPAERLAIFQGGALLHGVSNSLPAKQNCYIIVIRCTTVAFLKTVLVLVTLAAVSFRPPAYACAYNNTDVGQRFLMKQFDIASP